MHYNSTTESKRKHYNDCLSGLYSKWYGESYNCGHFEFKRNFQVVPYLCAWMERGPFHFTSLSASFKLNESLG